LAVQSTQTTQSGHDVTKSLCLTLFLLAFNLARAQDPCVTQRNTLEMNQCATQTLKKADAELNAVYRKVILKFSTPDEPGIPYSEFKKQIVDAQRAWITFRDKDCNAVLAINSPGTISFVIQAGCLQSRTEHRTTELSEYLKG
jgi:uncharacterized protein YecT (DUF1311 family)